MTAIPYRVAEVIPTKDLHPQQVLMSETMFYNVQNAFKCPFSNDVTLKITKAEDCSNISFQFASRVVVELIQTPQEVHQGLVKNCLSNYFEKARLLNVDDIFAIHIASFVPEAYYSSGLENMSHLYFKVLELEGPPYESSLDCGSLGYLVVKNEATLLQKNGQSFIPSSTVIFRNIQHDFTLTNFPDKLLQSCPPALDKLHNTLVQSLKPFLKNRKKIARCSSIKPVFWLIGPAGSGKQSVLSSLAAHLGIHLWNFNCDEVFGKVSGQIEGKLKGLFAKARTVTPCLLVISDIQVGEVVFGVHSLFKV